MVNVLICKMGIIILLTLYSYCECWETSDYIYQLTVEVVMMVEMVVVVKIVMIVVVVEILM